MLHIQCQIPDCERIFIRYSYFRTHWFKHHSRPAIQIGALADNEGTVYVAVYVAEKNVCHVMYDMSVCLYLLLSVFILTFLFYPAD